MDREKDGIRNFELATRSGNGRKRANSELSRDAGRQFETFVSRVRYLPFENPHKISPWLEKSAKYAILKYVFKTEDV